MATARPLMDSKTVRPVPASLPISATFAPPSPSDGRDASKPKPKSKPQPQPTSTSTRDDAHPPSKRAKVGESNLNLTRKPHVHPKTPAQRARIVVRRALTPSTSTVAFSSSPPRLSSPPLHRTHPHDTPTTTPAPASRVHLTQPTGVKRKPTVSLRHDATAARARAAELGCEAVTLGLGETLIFGRHRHRLTTPPTSSPSAPSHLASTPTDLASSIPAAMHHLVTLSNSGRTISLPRTAQHASRVHAAIELIPSLSPSTSLHSLRVLVLGQNGARVRPVTRTPGSAKSTRLLKGASACFESSVEIDFHGAKMVIIVENGAEAPDAHMDMDIEVEEEEEENLFETSAFPPSPATSAMPPSSPPVFHASTVPSSPGLQALADAAVALSASSSPQADDLHSPAPLDLAATETPAVESASPVMIPVSEFLPEPAPGRERDSSSPLSDLEPDADADADAVEEKIDISADILVGPISVNNAEVSAQTDSVEVKAHDHVKAEPVQPEPTPVEPCPADIDLSALLASTVVFSGSSKLSLPDLVKSLLESQPSLREHGDEDKWSVWASDALESNAMFGKVERHGKDASGRPLLSHYYYNPDADTDLARAKELGGLVRPLRAAQRVGGKALDWRPVGSGRRRY